MNRIPTEMLNQTATLEQYAGESAVGPVYESPVELPCRLEPKKRLIIDPRSRTEVHTKGRMFLFPEAEVAVESRITERGESYRVLEVNPQPGLNGDLHHVEVWLG